MTCDDMCAVLDLEFCLVFQKNKHVSKDMFLSVASLTIGFA